MRRVGTVLGSMEFGRGQCVGTMPQEMVDSFLAHNEETRHIDTAFMYTGGQSEEILGDMASWREKNGHIGTKLNPWDGKNYKEESLREQLSTCLKRLKSDKIELLYLHAPDHNTDIEETMRVMNDMHKNGLFAKLGLSNYSSWEVARTVEICRKNDWIQPSVYQGMYSCLTRTVEEELIPCLRHYGIAFYAYSPLAGGLLTGKYSYEQEKDKSISVGRFNGVGWDKVYRQRYWKKEYFDQIEGLKVLLKEVYPEETVTVAEAAFRWIYNHSKLSAENGDCVILGASSLNQLKINLDLSDKPPLEKVIVKYFDNWWQETKGLCPKYFR